MNNSTLYRTVPIRGRGFRKRYEKEGRKEEFSPFPAKSNNSRRRKFLVLRTQNPISRQGKEGVTTEVSLILSLCVLCISIFIYLSVISLSFLVPAYIFWYKYFLLLLVSFSFIFSLFIRSYIHLIQLFFSFNLLLVEQVLFSRWLDKLLDLHPHSILIHSFLVLIISHNQPLWHLGFSIVAPQHTILTT